MNKPVFYDQKGWNVYFRSFFIHDKLLQYHQLRNWHTLTSSREDIFCSIKHDAACRNDCGKVGIRQCGKMVTLFFNIWPLMYHFEKLPINIKKLPKFCLKLNKPSTIWQRFINFCQSGEISPYLVTLASNNPNPIIGNLNLLFTHSMLSGTFGKKDQELQTGPLKRRQQFRWTIYHSSKLQVIEDQTPDLSNIGKINF